MQSNCSDQSERRCRQDHNGGQSGRELGTARQKSPACRCGCTGYKDGKYSITLTDKNGVLSNYSFSSSDGNVSVSKSGNKLTISSAAAVSGSVRITAKRNGVPTVSESAKMIAYGDPNLQDVVTGVENADTVAAYLNVETPTGTIALKKTSEDGVVGGIQFNIKGDNFNKTVTTDKDGNISVEGLFPATYTITEQSIDRYEPQESQTVTLIGGKTTTVNFNNTLKRGSLEIIKNSEDKLVEGVKFHLYGTSLSGLPVDEYAVTNEKGVAKFPNVLISGDTPYVVEEVDTAIRYVVPASQTAPIEWEKVTSRTFVNVLKKFNVTVTKSDVETGTEQGDASLAGAFYGIYKGEELIDNLYDGRKRTVYKQVLYLQRRLDSKRAYTVRGLLARPDYSQSRCRARALYRGI